MNFRRSSVRRAAMAIALTTTLLPAFIGLRAAPSADPPQDARPDAFEQIDLDFRSLYGGGRATTLAHLDPVIVVEMDSLILIRPGKPRDEAKAIPTLYHRLKAVSHAPLALYVALAPYGDGPIEEERLAKLRTFRDRIAALKEALADSGFNPEQLARSRSLIDRCSAFLDGVLDAGKHDPKEMIALTRFAGPIVLANASDAARAQIDGYRAQVTEWRREMSAEEWGRLRVLVMGPQMPRKHNVAVQYFAKLMGLPGESPRLVYAEELTGEPAALNLLATHKLDGELSAAFFADPDRMEIDLLGNAAATYLDGLDLGR